MKYTGRIVIIAVAVVFILTVRSYSYFYLDYDTYNVPHVGLLFVVVCWLLGTQYDKLKFVSEKDVLTTLYNRRFMLNAFPKLFSSARRQQKKLILYFIDVDDFKIINDNHGHEMGDRVLQRIAYVLLQASDKQDVVVRWAGDEFLILSHSSDDQSKAKMISFMKEQLWSASREFNISISVSIGTSVFPDHAQTLDELLHVADIDMYKMKIDNSI